MVIRSHPRKPAACANASRVKNARWTWRKRSHEIPFRDAYPAGFLDRTALSFDLGAVVRKTKRSRMPVRAYITVHIPDDHYPEFLKAFVRFCRTLEQIARWELTYCALEKERDTFAYSSPALTVPVMWPDDNAATPQTGD